MNENWLFAPFCELSFIKLNDFNDILKVNNFIKKLETLNYDIKIAENNIDNKIINFLNGNSIEIDIDIYIYGNKHSRIIIEYLSDELIQIDFCFSDGDVNEKDIVKFKLLLNELIVEYDGIVGMIGWETVSNMIFFKIKEDFPHKEYSIKNLIHYTNKNIYKNNKIRLAGVKEILWNKKYEIEKQNILVRRLTGL
jgi:hypothetical protein